MINTINYFCFAIVAMTAVLSISSVVLSRVLGSGNSPTMWSHSMALSFAGAILATLLFSIPALNPSAAFELQIQHLPLAPAEFLGLSAQPTNTSNGPSLSINVCIALAYLIGTSVFLLRLRNGRARAQKIAASATPCVSATGIKYWLHDKHFSPFVIHTSALMSGWRQAEFKIVLPRQLATQISPEQIDHILRHELGHVENRDDRKGLILRVLLALSWFNPLSHYLVAQWFRCIELRSDEYATHPYRETTRKEYAETLLKVLGLTANRVQQYPVASFSLKQNSNNTFSTNRLRNEKMRIKSILHGHVSTIKSARYKAAIVASTSLIGLIASTLISVSACGGSTASSNLVNQDQLILSGRLTAKYGLSPHPFKKGQQRNHKGIDIAAPINSPIYAPNDGVVIEATDLYQGKPKYGKVLVLQTQGNDGSDSVKIMFAHLNSYGVKKGQRVRAGQLLARVGNTGVSTGPHVHIETFSKGARLDPLALWQVAE